MKNGGSQSTENKKKKKFLPAVAALASVTILLNLMAFSKSFCDFYTDHIYPVLNFIIGTLTSPFPFALGEIIMYLGAVALIALPVIAVLLIFLRRKERYKRFALGYVKGIALTLLIFLLVYTTNWFIPFRCRILRAGDNTRKEYSIYELAEVRRIIVNRLNELAVLVPRNDEGHLRYDYTEKDIVEAMRGLGERYPRLKGRYSKAKPALCSNFLEWMHIGGYNYIYTMEPTYNKYCDKLTIPVMIAHELSHHKGYYRENEAEFLSTVALAECDNLILQYCAYLEMYYYLQKAYNEAIVDYINASGMAYSKEMYKEAIQRLGLEKEPVLSAVVSEDQWFAYQESKEFYEQNANQFIV